MKVLVTGSNGFVGGYLVDELLANGWDVVGLDNFSKYGRVRRSYDADPRYRLVEGDAKDVALLQRLLADCDHFLAGAAMVGGISFFRTHAYDLLAENERITAAAFDAAIRAHREKKLRKITVMSSAIVFDNAPVVPTPEGEEKRCAPPPSTYGIQKLAAEYYARGAREQYGLPYTILRPSNVVGIGEGRALGGAKVTSGNLTLAMSHVVPDLAQKVLRGQDPLHVLGDGTQVRNYTYGGDLARGIRIAIEHPAALNEDFNISTPRMTTVLELAQAIWRKVNGDRPFRFVGSPPLEHDVARRAPDVAKAKRLLGFEAATSLETMLDEVIPWVREQISREAI